MTQIHTYSLWKALQGDLRKHTSSCKFISHFESYSILVFPDIITVVFSPVGIIPLNSNFFIAVFTSTAKD